MPNYSNYYRNGQRTDGFPEGLTNAEKRAVRRSISHRMRARREELGLTQTELALKAGYRSACTVANVENGLFSQVPEKIDGILEEKRNGRWLRVPLCRSKILRANKRIGQSEYAHYRGIHWVHVTVGARMYLTGCRVAEGVIINDGRSCYPSMGKIRAFPK